MAMKVYDHLALDSRSNTEIYTRIALTTSCNVKPLHQSPILSSFFTPSPVSAVSKSATTLHPLTNKILHIRSNLSGNVHTVISPYPHSLACAFALSINNGKTPCPRLSGLTAAIRMCSSSYPISAWVRGRVKKNPMG